MHDSGYKNLLTSLVTSEGLLLLIIQPRSYFDVAHKRSTLHKDRITNDHQLNHDSSNQIQHPAKTSYGRVRPTVSERD